MSALNSQQLWGPVDPVIRKFFGLGVKSVKPVFKQIYDVSRGTEAIRHSMELGGPGQLTLKTEGGNIGSLSVKQGTNKTFLYEVYAGRIEMTFELARDNKVREIKSVSRTLGRSTALTPEYKAALALDNAFDSTTSSVTADAKAWCATNHTIVGTLAATGANRPSTDAALSETSLEDAYTALMTIQGADGMIARVMPEKLVVPPALALQARKLVKAGKTLGSANNDPKVVGDDLTLVENPFLVSTKQWFVLTDASDGLWFEWDIEADFMEDQVMTNLNRAYIAVQRFRLGCDEWRGIYGNSPS